MCFEQDKIEQGYYSIAQAADKARKIKREQRKSMQAIILAAGFGTRLRPYTLIRPKPLFPILNRPLLHRLLDMLTTVGCQRIIVNCHHLAAQVRGALGPYSEVICQYEPKILGTGGSLRLALNHLDDEPLLVMNGDIVHTIDLAALYRYHCSSGNPVTMAVHDCPRFNTVAVAGNRVLSFQPVPGASRLAFTGIHVVEPHILTKIPEHSFFHIIDLYQELAGRGRVGILRVDGALWRDIGTPEDYLQLHGDLLTGPADREIVGAGTMQGNWLFAENAQIAGGVELKDWGCLGRGVRVGQGAQLARCVVWDGVKIAPGSRIEDAIVTGSVLKAALS